MSQTFGSYVVHRHRNGETELVHGPSGQRVAVIHSAWERSGLLAPKTWAHRVTNQPGATKSDFLTLECAIEHSIELHQQQLAHGEPAHPIEGVAVRMNLLGESLYAAMSDLRTSDEQRDALQETLTAYAALVERFNARFG